MGTIIRQRGTLKLKTNSEKRRVITLHSSLFVFHFLLEFWTVNTAVLRTADEVDHGKLKTSITPASFT